MFFVHNFSNECLDYIFAIPWSTWMGNDSFRIRDGNFDLLLMNIQYIKGKIRCGAEM
jgi:hypothetical protein